MRIGVISDTHDQIERIKKAVALFTGENVDLVVHCGDIVSPFTLQFYRGLKCPMKALFGNNTGDLLRHLAYRKEFELENIEFITVPFMAIPMGGRTIGIYHGDVPEITEALIHSKMFDCVFSGHSHIAKIEEYEEILHVNPGTLLDRYKEGMSEKPTVAIYETVSNRAQLVYVE
jgi:putative phosphoesterase